MNKKHPFPGGLDGNAQMSVSVPGTTAPSCPGSASGKGRSLWFCSLDALVGHGSHLHVCLWECVSVCMQICMCVSSLTLYTHKTWVLTTTWVMVPVTFSWSLNSSVLLGEGLLRDTCSLPLLQKSEEEHWDLFLFPSPQNMQQSRHNSTSLALW